MRVTSWIVGLIAMCLSAEVSRGLTVTGSVVDASAPPLPVPSVKVEIWDEDIVYHDLLDVVYTTQAGAFTSMAASEGDDIFVVVKWEMQLVPSAFYNQRVIRLLDIGQGTNPYVIATQFTSTQSATFSGITANLVIPTIAMGQVQPLVSAGGASALPGLTARIHEVLDFVRNNKGSVTWTPNYDVPVHILTDQAARHSAGDVYLPNLCFNGGGTPFWIITLYHEMAHLIHYRLNGDQLPNTGTGCQVHTINSEEIPECALVEGWASYVAQRTADGTGVNNPQFYARYRDPQNVHWRGDEAAPTGRQGLAWESGEVVEGAVAGVCFGIDDDPNFTFADNLGVMVQRHPDNIYQFLDEFVNHHLPGWGSSVDLVFDIAQRHGIVYSRALFANPPFAEGDPPDAGPPSPGNFKLIAGIPFLRGTISANFQAAIAAELGVAQGLNVSHVAVGYKPAHDDLYDCPFDFADWAGLESFAAGFVSVDTTAFDGTPDGQGGDGDWDLVVRSVNINAYADNFLPTWSWSPLVTPARRAHPPLRLPESPTATPP